MKRIATYLMAINDANLNSRFDIIRFLKKEFDLKLKHAKEVSEVYLTVKGLVDDFKYNDN